MTCGHRFFLSSHPRPSPLSYPFPSSAESGRPLTKGLTSARLWYILGHTPDCRVLPGESPPAFCEYSQPNSMSFYQKAILCFLSWGYQCHDLGYHLLTASHLFSNIPLSLFLDADRKRDQPLFDEVRCLLVIFFSPVLYTRQDFLPLFFSFFLFKEPEE